MNSETEMLKQARRRALVLALILLGVLVYGTAGYRCISGATASWLDCLYMTSITITTIGFGEVLPGGEAPAARLFTLTLVFLGVGIFTYALSSITFFATDEGLRTRWRRRRMEQAIKGWSQHYVIGGWSVMAARIAEELQATARHAVAVVPGGSAEEAARRLNARHFLVIEGDPSDEDALRRAGLEKAAGFFAVGADDATNIVACLSARQLNPHLRIVAAADDPRHGEKMRRAGADAVVSAPAIGALRMASEMVRPMVVSFLDTMLRSANPVLRVEEITPIPRFEGMPLGELLAPSGHRALLLALRQKTEWIFNPPPQRLLAKGDTLIVMTSPDELETLRARLT